MRRVTILQHIQRLPCVVTDVHFQGLRDVEESDMVGYYCNRYEGNE